MTSIIRVGFMPILFVSFEPMKCTYLLLFIEVVRRKYIFPDNTRAYQLVEANKQQHDDIYSFFGLACNLQIHRWSRLFYEKNILKRFAWFKTRLMSKKKKKTGKKLPITKKELWFDDKNKLVRSNFETFICKSHIVRLKCMRKKNMFCFLHKFIFTIFVLKWI